MGDNETSWRGVAGDGIGEVGFQYTIGATDGTQKWKEPHGIDHENDAAVRNVEAIRSQNEMSELQNY
jgi:hypothetical protein